MKHQAFIRDVINLHDLKTLHLSIFTSSLICWLIVREKLYAKYALFLDGMFASFMAMSEGRPDLAKRQHVAKVTVEMAKYFHFPYGLSDNPFKHADLLSYLEEALVPLCKFLFVQFTRPHVHLAPQWFSISFS